MICRSCKKNVESSMRHAIAANSCPFCGNSIFDTNEFAFRKSVSRVLIKNGLDNDDQINKIVDDILSLAAGTPVQSIEDSPSPIVVPQIVAPTQVSAAAVAHATTEEEKIAKFQAQAEALAKARVATAARAAEDDGLTEAERYAPARVLSPAPKPTAQLVTRAGEDPIALAMREFSAAQDLDAKFAREDQMADRAEVTEDDLAGVFFMEAGVASEKAERLKGSMSTGNARPAFRRS